MKREYGISFTLEVLLIIWTSTTDLESGIFNDGGGLLMDAMGGEWRIRNPEVCV